MRFWLLSLHSSVQPTLKWKRDEIFNERNGAIDPPFIVMPRRSQSITAVLIFCLRWRGSEGLLAGLWRDLPPNLCALGFLLMLLSFIIRASVSS